MKLTVQVSKIVLLEEKNHRHFITIRLYRHTIGAHLCNVITAPQSHTPPKKNWQFHQRNIPKTIRSISKKTNPEPEEWIQAQNRRPGMPAEHLLSLEPCIKRKQMFGWHPCNSELRFNPQAQDWFLNIGLNVVLLPNKSSSTRLPKSTRFGAFRPSAKCVCFFAKCYFYFNIISMKKIQNIETSDIFFMLFYFLAFFLCVLNTFSYFIFDTSFKL